MTKTAAVIATALTMLAMLYSVSQPEVVADLPSVSLPWAPAECTEKLEIECAIEV